MVQMIKQGNIFGRIGSSIGQGLAEQIPKEVERNRLSSGLKAIGENKDLDPYQRFAETVGVAHEYPQIIQSAGELSRQQAMRNAYGQNGGQEPNKGAGGQGKKAIVQENAGVSSSGRQPTSENASIPSGFKNRQEEAMTGERLAKKNPAASELIPEIPFTQKERETDFDREARRNPYATFEQINAKVDDNERRRLAAPEAYRKQEEYLNNREDEAEKELDKQLETSLQKEGKDIYGDLTGDTLLGMKKAMINDLATNPDLTSKQAAEKWRKKGKDFVEQKNQIKELSNRDIFERISPTKKVENLKRLKEASKSYHDLDLSREYYNTLRSDFGMSPGGAAEIAYKKSDAVKQLINKTNFGLSSIDKIPYFSRKFAEEFGLNRTSYDSILGTARAMKDKEPFFDEISFFDYLRDHQDEYNLTPDQKKELLSGPSDIFSNWGDQSIFGGLNPASILREIFK